MVLMNVPKAVLIDTATLNTLPARELSAGLAEVIKYGLICDEPFLGWLEDNMNALRALDSAALTEAISRSCAAKAEPGAWIEGGSWVAAALKPGEQSLKRLDAALEDVADSNIKVCLKLLKDAKLLRQLLSNLMDNALKYSRQQPEPRVQVGFDSAQDAYFVRDNGMGFDMARASKLFGLFQRLHVHSEVPGMGVGLAIVSRIIERHGGSIWAESAPGQGATFWFRLPRA